LRAGIYAEDKTKTMIKIFSHRLLKKGNVAQTLSEYAILIGIVTAAILSMQVFVRRRTQAVIFDTINEFGDPAYIQEYNPLLGGRAVVSNYERTADSASLISGAGGIAITDLDVTTNGSGFSERIDEIED
jgi:hypothetical protein